MYFKVVWCEAHYCVTGWGDGQRIARGETWKYWINRNARPGNTGEAICREKKAVCVLERCVVVVVVVRLKHVRDYMCCAVAEYMSVVCELC